jgi:epoxyqueuosine reductase
VSIQKAASNSPLFSFETLHALALSVGLDAVSVYPADPAPSRESLFRWLDAGYAGEMHWMIRTSLLRVDPLRLLPGARSLLVALMRYDGRPATVRRGEGRIARYAWGREYHRVFRKRLRKLWQHLQRMAGFRPAHARIFVDSSPLFERDYAAAAGLGWRAKNTHLIHPRWGSYVFIGVLLTTLDLPRPSAAPMQVALYGDSPRRLTPPWSLCGSCTRCLEACPTRAFVGPGVLDARRCISYLTIEYHGPIPVSLRAKMGNWLVGCDVCQEVCPWNHKLLPLPETHPFTGTPGTQAVSLREALTMDEETFHRRFRGRAVRRLSLEQFRRNAAVAMGNTGSADDLPFLRERIRLEPSPLVREHLQWALRRLEKRGKAAQS